MSITQRVPASFRIGIPAKLIKIKTEHVILLSGSVVAVAYLMVGVALLKQSSAQKKLTEDTAVMENTMPSLKSVNLAKAQVDLDAAQAKLNASKSAIPQNSYTTGFVSSLLDISNSYNLEVASLQSFDPKEQVIGVHKYEATAVTIVLRGPEKDMASFSRTLEQTTYPLTIKNVQLQTNTDGVAEMSVTFDIYSRTSDDVILPPVVKPTATKPQVLP